MLPNFTQIPQLLGQDLACQTGLHQRRLQRQFDRQRNGLPDPPLTAITQQYMSENFKLNRTSEELSRSTLVATHSQQRFDLLPVQHLAKTAAQQAQQLCMQLHNPILTHFRIGVPNALLALQSNRCGVQCATQEEICILEQCILEVS